jgi:hypothetical protein
VRHQQVGIALVSMFEPMLIEALEKQLAAASTR